MTVTRERLPQFRDVDVDGLSRRRGRRNPPELVDQALARHELVRVQEQNAEDESLFQRPESDRVPVLEHLERTEDSKLHHAVLPLRKSDWKGPRPTVLTRS